MEEPERSEGGERVFTVNEEAHVGGAAY